MEDDRMIHPIRRIRDALAQLPDRSNLGEVRSFARWLGYSESLIRNVENGEAKLSEKLAKSIERKTSVSAEWLLRFPGPEEEILDRRGFTWNAGRLDLYSYLPNFERLLAACPTRLPGAVAKMFEAQILSEMHEKGSLNKLKMLLYLLEREDFFEESKSGGHAFHWLAQDKDPESMQGLILGLLMDRSPELSGEQIRNLENLRVTEPDIPEGSQLPKIYKKAKPRSRQSRKEKSEVDDG